MKKSDSIDKLAVALVKAQSELESAKKDSDNPFFKSKYADLASVWDACRDALTKNGLAVVQPFDNDENGGVIVETMLIHSSGQWLMGSLTLRPVKADPQGIGSAITYGRRYSLAAIVGVIQTDDDAEQAMGRNDKTATRRPVPTPIVKTKPVDATGGKTISTSDVAVLKKVAADNNWSAAELNDTVKTLLKKPDVNRLTDKQFEWLMVKIKSMPFEKFATEWQNRLG